MEFFFNELSVHNQFQSKKDFQNAVLLFRNYRKIITEAGFRMYIHRNILERSALGYTFRKGLQVCFDRQQVRTLMNWLSKDGFFLPDDACADTGKDRFICHYPEEMHKEPEDITGSALAECAFRKIAGADAGSISLEQSNFSWSPIKISLLQSDEAIIDNDYTPHSLGQRLVGYLPLMSSWSVLLERIEELPAVTIDPDVKKRLIANPFSQNVAEGIYFRAKELNEMSTATSIDRFNELFSKYATGEKARFSDSSPTEKREHKGALTFLVDDERRLCPYHGKVKIQQYRMHLASRPAFGKPARIVYIGPKLTKK
ncbi:MAG: hypothetical protein D3917_03195 [Candidatus Electrothrix sp. AX5]|nr:hypothetical protein [Candidatus Electrothrix sp. AX5]